MESGTKFGHYEFLSLLGKGGIGEVWRAKDTKLRREVAIKVLPEEFSRDADHLARFQREARAASALNHPNICIVHDLDEHVRDGCRGAGGFHAASLAVMGSRRQYRADRAHAE